MRFRDLLGLALSALCQQKLRTLLTTLGVVFASLVLVASLSVRDGVRDTIIREWSKHGELRQISVHAGHIPRRAEKPPEPEIHGQMSEAKRQRLRAELRQRGRERQAAVTAVPLTRARLAALAALPHVRSVDTFMVQEVRVLLKDRAARTSLMGATVATEPFRGRLLVGNYLPAEGRFAVVSEYLLYRLGIVDDADAASVLGTKLRLQYRTTAEAPELLLRLLRAPVTEELTVGQERVLERLLQLLPDAVDKLDLTPADKVAARLLLRPPVPNLPASSASTVGLLGLQLGEGPLLAGSALVAASSSPALAGEEVVEEEVTICGILRTANPAELNKEPAGWMHRQIEVLVPPKTADELYFRLLRRGEEGYRHAVVEVDAMEHVKEVNGLIRAMELRTEARWEWVERELFTYRLIFGAMTVIALVALLVAALGITNTMLMGVLERVREIGVMKAVGARDGSIQLIFLVEGALVGLVGGLLGLLLGWAGSFPGDAWVRSMVESGLSIKLDSSVFAFPWWLVVGAPLLACLITTLAAFYPARRAARVDPVKALRHD